MPTLHSLLHHYWKELLGLFTLSVSLWIAFGPLRHRLPRVLTRFGKYSATLKLLGLSGLCWIGFYHNVTDDEPSLALNWVLAGLGMLLLAGAIWVVTRKQAPRHAPAHATQPTAPPAPRPTSAARGST